MTAAGDVTAEVKVWSSRLFNSHRSFYLSVTWGRTTWWVMRWDVGRAPAGRFRSADGLVGWTWGRRSA